MTGRFSIKSSALLAAALFAAAWLGAYAAEGQGAFLSRVRQLTFEGRRSGEGYFSTDGSRLIFQSERETGNPFYQIYTLDFETGDTARVSPGHGKTTCAFFHPDGGRVLFGSTHHDPQSRAKQKAELDFRASGKERRYSWDYDETMDIFTANPDGSGLSRLTTARGYDAEAAFSTDGKQIVFGSTRSAYADDLTKEEKKLREVDLSYFGEIYIMNTDGSGQTRLTRTPGYDGGPFFSPDGSRIVWRRFNKSGAVAEIHTMKLDGSDVRKLTRFKSMSWAPYFHPSGDYIIFASNKLGFTNFELYLVDALGQCEPVRVTERAGFDGLPVFSPDGTRLCWTSNATPQKQSQLFLAKWNHTGALAALGQAPERADSQAILSPEVSIDDLKAHVTYLASDELEGRRTGSEGIRKAAQYIRQRLAKAGLQALGSERDRFDHAFEFTGGVELVKPENKMILRGHTGEDQAFELGRDFRPLAFSANGRVESEVVFAGYGLTKPGELGVGYNSYGDLNVKDKIVMVLRYVPEDISVDRRQELNRYAGLRYKALIARNNGAKALLVVTGPNSPNPGALAKLSFDTSMAGAGIPVLSVSGEVGNSLVELYGKSLKELQSSLDKENPHAVHGLALPGIILSIKTSLKRIRQQDSNLVALLPPTSQGDTAKPTEYVMLGAHYDHLGRGETGGFGVNGEEGMVHNGADDNASGVAALLEMAAHLARRQKTHPVEFQRGVIFSFWSGEELGLIGSARYAAQPTVNLSNVVAYLNFDMVGRLRDNKLTLQGVGSSGAWKKLIERRNVLAGFDLTLQQDPYLPTDTTSFYPKGIPVLAWFTGSHEEYHRPADDADTLNYEGIERITKFAGNVVRDLAKGGERPDYLKVEKNDQGGSRDAIRVYLGTIPDYASEDVKGVLLTGVRGGGPADKAGLKGGDVIVHFAGKDITNIYDYTYALDAVKVGKSVGIEVLRKGKRMKLSITPAARK
ncbi:MAG TPA: M20/M25/M40 family metallo-hydrolase [Verrucomicrobiota bacterium]|nr:M20/M25/M40 family metallo-hydrolase [Verrucomicrobiota bacterium]